MTVRLLSNSWSHVSEITTQKKLQKTFLQCVCSRKKFKNWQSSTENPTAFLRNKSKSFHQYLHNKIISSGPISVAEFMKSVLTNPYSGYYMHKDVIGPKGDFITSPELSQMFGELIGVWIINEWRALGEPSNVRIVEFGPGRGTLCQDILKTFKQLSTVWNDCELSVHLVELSPTLSKIQFQNLVEASDDGTHESEEKYPSYMSGHSSSGVPLYWHRTIDDVPQDSCIFFLAHEFFDALPIHKFNKANSGKWEEMYVDVDGKSTDLQFRFVLMPKPTPASKMLIKANEVRNHIEVSPESALVCQKIAQRISQHSGAALLADYGYYGDKEDTLRAFKDHQLVEVLTDFGNCDVTADVDFKYIVDSVHGLDVTTHGPVSQQTFLRNMGIDTRLMMLLRSTDDMDLRRQLTGSYDMMMNPEKMGERFKFLAFTSKSRKFDDEFAHVTGFS